jgi:hypothetical protein
MVNASGFGSCVAVSQGTAAKREGEIEGEADSEFDYGSDEVVPVAPADADEIEELAKRLEEAGERLKRALRSATLGRRLSNMKRRLPADH